MESIDCELITARDDHGTTVEAVVIPDGYLVCIIPAAKADGEWHECSAARIVAGEDGTIASLEVSDDLDWLTSPEAAK